MKQVSRRERHNKKQSRRAKRILRTLITCALLGATIGGMGYLLHDTPPLRLFSFKNFASATLVYASDRSTLLGRYATEGDRRPLHSLTAAGKYLPQAFIATEDKDFYHHIGIDPLAILRSLWTDARSQRLTTGGSTITQQLVKLVVFPKQERTWRRKVQEMALALSLEQVQSKQQILLEYLNALYFGTIHGVQVYGVQSAAEHFFGRTAQRLTPAQAALLAAIPNNPSLFSVSQNPKRVLVREQMILARMHTLGFLSTQQYTRAVTEPVIAELSHSPLLYAPYESRSPFIAVEVSRMAPTFIAQSENISLLQAQRLLETGGLRIYTSIVPKLQTRLETSAAAPDFPSPQSYAYHDQRGRHIVRQAQEQIGAVLLENSSSRILALGGGRNFALSQVDHALSRRQPGSALKPLVVYGPALDKGLITPGAIVDDVPRHYPDPSSPHGDWFPLNWDRRFHGLMTARDALMQSFNSPAIDLLSRIGTQTGARYARLVGLRGIATEDEQSLGLAIGGIHGGVSPWELAGAYAAIPMGGLYTPPSLIDTIEDGDGRVIYRRSQVHTQVWSQHTAYLLTRMLQTVVSSPFGTAYLLHGLTQNSDLAGKTGTTDDNRDAWFTGFTPHFTMSVWAGYDIPHPLPLHGAIQESSRPLRVFAATLGPSMQRDAQHFQAVSGIRAYEICTKSGLLAGPLCKAAGETETDYFPVDAAPQEVCQLHRLVTTTWLNDKRYLATELTPVAMIQQEVLLNRLPDTIDPRDEKYTPIDTRESVPIEADPRGGNPLTP